MGAAGRCGAGRHRVRAVPSHGPASPADAPAVAVRSAARTWCLAARHRRRAVRRRAVAPRRGVPGHDPAHDRTGRDPPLARRHRPRPIRRRDSRRSTRRWTRWGSDPATDWIPIAPAAHYLCGGIVTDLNGSSSLPRLWAAGEVTLHRRPRRQPAGVQFAARRDGVRPSGHRGHRGGPGRTGRHRGHAIGDGRRAGDPRTVRSRSICRAERRRSVTWQPVAGGSSGP